MLAAALAAEAETIYKQQLPDGSVVYADHRIKGAKLLYRVSIPDEQTQPADQAAASRSKAEAAMVDKRLRARSEALDRAQREIVDAEQALQKVKRQLEAGKEPVGGEVQSSAMGGTRVLPQYYDRIKKLEESVAEAQARVDRAYKARNQLR
jgi:multidrug efflux pump subunit AcrA (membrane-fusion protein)